MDTLNKQNKKELNVLDKSVNKTNTPLEILASTADEIRKNYYRQLRFVAQASDGTMEMHEAPKSQEEMVADFHHEMSSAVLSMVPKSIDATYQPNDYVVSSLSTWLSRPRVILSQVWTPNSNFPSIQFFPYQEFLTGLGSVPLIKKLDNHFLLRGTLKLKFLVNGSPFHYGRVRACFRPGQFDNSYPNNLDPRQALTAFNYPGFTTYPPLLTTYSQRPGVLIDPGTNLPVEMELPFMCVKNYIDLRSQTADMQQLGAINMYVQNQLRHANGALDPVTITVYANMVNPVLSTPSSQNAFQGEAKDEYGQGIISKPASAVAKFAGRLKDIPVIGKMALATEIGANAVSQISSIWGYTRTISLEPSVPMRPKLIGSLALTSGDDTIAKLSLDPKQEISVDPSTVGLQSIDQMAISYMAQRESLLVVMPWTTTQGNNSIIGAIKVHPNVYPVSLSSAPALRVHYPTALAYVSKPFAAWRGSMRYRVQIVASANHRGRILVQYEPGLSGANATPNLSTRFSQILDLTESRDMTFSVNYNRSDMYLPTDWEYVSDSSVSSTAGGAFLTGNKLSVNGSLIFFVLNELAAPLATSTVEINVYVKAGDDFELHNPTKEELNQYSFREPTTFAGSVVSLAAPIDELEEEEFQAESKFTGMVDCENEPEQCQYHVINGSAESSVGEDYKRIMFGEQIVSIRTLMKRYNVVDVVKPDSNPANPSKAYTFNRPNLPAGPGLAYGNSTPTVGTYNYCKMNYIRWFMGGFAGYKGNVRYKILVVSPADGNYMWVERTTDFKTPAARIVNLEQTVVGSAAEGPATFQFNFGTRFDDLGTKSGAEVTYYPDNAVLEYELPWQSFQRFQYCHNFLYGNDLPVNYSYNDGQKQNHRINLMTTTGNLSENGIITLCAAGEDFSLFFFINAPIFFERNIQPPP